MHISDNIFIRVILISVFTSFFTSGDAQRVKDRMYETISSTNACFRRLNATHQIGCSSSNSGSTGVIHVIDTQTDIDWALNTGPAGPYILILPTQFFTRTNLIALKNAYPKQISGVVLVTANSTRPDYYSHESVCPNEYSQLNGTCDTNDGWNDHGTNLLHEDVPFPIFLLNNQTEIAWIRAYFEKFNAVDLDRQRERALASLELSSFMLAARNTQTCLRRSNLVVNFVTVKFCDPLGDKNIWATLKPIRFDESKQTPVKKEKYILIVTHLDTTTMFDGVTPGAANPISGLVTYLTTAYLLKKMIADKLNTYDSNILFAIFNGESFDYIGSQKFVYDMTNGNFPLRRKSGLDRGVPAIQFDDIALIVEVNQISDRAALNVFHGVYANAAANETASAFVARLKSQSKKVGVTVQVSSSNKLPPSSIQMFARRNGDVPTLVITDHDNHYKNKYYNSIFDNKDNLNYTYYNGTANMTDDTSYIPKTSIQRYLSNVATLLAGAVYSQLLNESYAEAAIDTAILVDELMYCYLITPDCLIFNAITNKNMNIQLQQQPLSLYVGVNSWANPITTLTGYTLGLFTGDATNRTNADDCVASDTKEGEKVSTKSLIVLNIWVNGLNETLLNISTETSASPTGVCVQTTLHFTLAQSPAFEIQDYDWTSGEYSTWSESVWREFGVRIFLRPSRSQELFTFTLGACVCAISIALVYFFTSKSHVLFDHNSVIATNC